MLTLLSKPAIQQKDFEMMDINQEKGYLCVLNFDEVNAAVPYLPISEELLYQSQNIRTSKFESHEGFDFITLNIPNSIDILQDTDQNGIYLRKNLLVFICEDKKLCQSIIDNFNSKDCKENTLSKILFDFFNLLTAKDTFQLESLEQEISNLEEELILSPKHDGLKEIMILRKKLLRLKRYYEQLYEVAQNLERNENELLDKKILHEFRSLTGRIDRLMHSVLNLRDYLSQVREAYQSQIDINLNNVMKIFTVITAIFLPLSLIAGWYGMNFNMPEYQSPYGYPIVIGISVLVVGFCIFLFKKNHWF